MDRSSSSVALAPAELFVAESVPSVAAALGLA